MPGIGLDSFSYHLHLDDADHPRDAFWFLRRILDLKLNGCSFSPKHLRGWDESLIRDVGAFCQHHDLYLELASSASDYARLCRRLILCSEVGARMLRTHIAQVPEVSEVQRSVHLSLAIENLKRLSEVAECVGVVLGIINRPDLTAAELAGILHRVGSPFVRASFCNAEALAAREDPLEAASALAPYIGAVMLRDLRVRDESGQLANEACIFGQGDGRIGEVFVILSRDCPKAPVTLAPRHALQSLEEEEAHVRQSVEFVRELDKHRVLVR